MMPLTDSDRCMAVKEALECALTLADERVTVAEQMARRARSDGQASIVGLFAAELSRCRRMRANIEFALAVTRPEDSGSDEANPTPDASNGQHSPGHWKFSWHPRRWMHAQETRA